MERDILIHAFEQYLLKIDYSSDIINKASGELKDESYIALMNMCIQESLEEWYKNFKEYSNILFDDIKYGTNKYHDTFVSFVTFVKLSPLASESNFKFLFNDMISHISNRLKTYFYSSPIETYRQRSICIASAIIMNMLTVECDDVELFIKYTIFSLKDPDLCKYYAPSTQAFANLVSMIREQVPKQKRIKIFE